MQELPSTEENYCLLLWIVLDNMPMCCEDDNLERDDRQ